MSELVDAVVVGGKAWSGQKNGARHRYFPGEHVQVSPTQLARSPNLQAATELKAKAMIEDAIEEAERTEANSEQADKEAAAADGAGEESSNDEDSE